MIVFSEEERREKISETELLYMGRQIMKFVNVYRKFIVVYSDEHKQMLDTLEQISFDILTHQYEKLFGNPNLVDTSESEDLPF